MSSVASSKNRGKAAKKMKCVLAQVNVAAVWLASQLARGLSRGLSHAMDNSAYPDQRALEIYVLYSMYYM